MRTAMLALLLGAALPALADEGMWTFDNFPAAAVKAKYGATLDSAWLDRVRRSTIRLSNCTASFVSPEGLILTNHHCVEACLANLSSRDQSLVQTGFVSRSRNDEPRCATQVADVLQAMENVTDKVMQAISGLDQTAANEARKKALTQLEQACEKSTRLKCESVTLYQGGQYFLYKYKRYDDVRLVLAPEADIAAFGGDPDNFQFPRWSLDFSMLRAYENGKPAKTPDHLPIRFAGPEAGEFVLVSGHPGSTERLDTRAELEFQRDLVLPNWLLRYSELRGRYIQYGKGSEAAARIVEEPLNSLENGIKVRRKLLDALHEDSLLEAKSEAEQALRVKMAGDASFGDPWADIARATAIERGLYLPYLFLERSRRLQQCDLPLRPHARARCRRARQAEHGAAARVRRHGAAAACATDTRGDPRLPGARESHAVVLARTDARMARPRSPGGAPIAREGFPGQPRRETDRWDEARRPGHPQAAVGRRRGGHRRVERPDDPARACDRRALARSAQALRGRGRSADHRASGENRPAVAYVYGTNVYPDAIFTLRLNHASTVAG